MAAMACHLVSFFLLSKSDILKWLPIFSNFLFPAFFYSPSYHVLDSIGSVHTVISPPSAFPSPLKILLSHAGAWIDDPPIPGRRVPFFHNFLLIRTYRYGSSYVHYSTSCPVQCYIRRFRLLFRFPPLSFISQGFPVFRSLAHRLNRRWKSGRLVLADWIFTFSLIFCDIYCDVVNYFRLSTCLPRLLARHFFQFMKPVSFYDFSGDILELEIDSMRPVVLTLLWTASVTARDLPVIYGVWLCRKRWWDVEASQVFMIR